MTCRDRAGDASGHGAGRREAAGDAGLATERNRHPLASAGNLAVVGAPIAWCARAGLARYGIFAGTGFP